MARLHTRTIKGTTGNIIRAIVKDDGNGNPIAELIRDKVFYDVTDEALIKALQRDYGKDSVNQPFFMSELQTVEEKLAVLEDGYLKYIKLMGRKLTQNEVAKPNEYYTTFTAYNFTFVQLTADKKGIEEKTITINVPTWEMAVKELLKQRGLTTYIKDDYEVTTFTESYAIARVLEVDYMRKHNLNKE